MVLQSQDHDKKEKKYIINMKCEALYTFVASSIFMQMNIYCY